MTRRTNIDERELRDPALAALLRDSYQDDPALEPAPGRTERIMRTVLASAPRRQAHPFWASLAWGFGAAAMAILLLALIIGFGQPGQKVVKHEPVPPIHRQPQAPKFDMPDIDEYADLDKTQLPQPARNVIPEALPKPEEKPPTAWQPASPRQEPVVVPPAPDRQEVVVAAALYEAGATAYSTGDYESAYMAFQDSYDTVPTPEAALSTGNALMRMAREELATADSDT